MVYFILFFAGILQGITVALNGQLSNYLSAYAISFFAHAIPSVILIVYLHLQKKGNRSLKGAPWYVYLIGFIGMSLCTISSYTSGKLGSATVMSLTVVGQTLMSEGMDWLGLLGVPKCKFNSRCLLYYLLIIVGVIMVVAY